MKAIDRAYIYTVVCIRLALGFVTLVEVMFLLELLELQSL